MIKSRVLGATLLVSGTAIGAGMLALPMATGSIGFIPSAITFVFCWLFMTFAALLLLEANLWLTGEKDLISMVGATLGLWGKMLAWCLSLLLLYALVSAYFTASSAWLIKVVAPYFVLNKLESVIILAVVFGAILAYGTVLVDNINRLLTFGLVVAYGILIASALPHVELSRIEVGDVSKIPVTLSLMTTAFGFSVIVPSLSDYLERNSKALVKVIVWGGFIPLVVYLLWEWVTLGIIPVEGSGGLKALLASHNDGTGVVVALERIVGNEWITKSAGSFSIFAILTSLLGVSLALFHFLADGLKIEAKGLKRLLILLPTYCPPILIVIFYPTGFDRILSFSGIFVSVLLGILPALMVWVGRYYQGRSKEGFRVFGGKALLVLVIAFYAYIVYLEIVNCLCFA